MRYHLDITIPNGVVDDVVPLISAYESDRVEVISLHALPEDIKPIANLIRAELPDIVVIGKTTDEQGESLTELVHGFAHESISIGLASTSKSSAVVLYRVDRFASPTRATQYGDAPGSDFEYLIIPRESAEGIPVHVTTSSDPKLQPGARSALVWHEYLDEPDRWSTASTPDANAHSLWVPDTIEVTELETFRVGDFHIDRAILTLRGSLEPSTE